MLVPNFVQRTSFGTVLSIKAKGPILLGSRRDDVNRNQLGNIAETLNLIGHRENAEAAACAKLQNALWFPAANDFPEEESSLEIRREVSFAFFLQPSELSNFQDASFLHIVTKTTQPTSERGSYSRHSEMSCNF